MSPKHRHVGCPSRRNGLECWRCTLWFQFGWAYLEKWPPKAPKGQISNYLQFLQNMGIQKPVPYESIHSTEKHLFVCIHLDKYTSRTAKSGRDCFTPLLRRPIQAYERTICSDTARFPPFLSSYSLHAGKSPDTSRSGRCKIPPDAGKH